MLNGLDWKVPALVGGLIVGVFSMVPGLNLVNCCFCGWALIGGAVSAKMLIGRTPRPVKSGEGAQVGLIAGLIAGAVTFVVGLPMSLFGEGFSRGFLEMISQRLNNPELQDAIQKALEASATQSPAQKLIGAIPILLMFSVVYAGFTVLGGLLGVALFEKRKDQPPPPYPPQYPQGGDAGGGYGGQNWPPA
jgi:hypothetical protein